MLSEISVPLLMQQIMDAAVKESSYVGVSFETVTVNGQEQLSIAFNTTATNNIITRLQNA